MIDDFGEHALYVKLSYSHYPHIAIFAIEKKKIAKNVLDKKAFAAGITAPIL